VDYISEFRKSDKSIGSAWYQIPMDLRTLIENCKLWIEKKSFGEDEIAVRFKHKIVSIHCFPNGNGRHSRLVADVLVSHVFGRPAFTWGTAADLVKKGLAREKYLDALKKADKGDIQELVRFARS
jgi:Fic-DOC domain mobile mystery protein B